MRWCQTNSSIFYLKTQAGWRETAEVKDIVSREGDETSAKDKLKKFLDDIAASSSRIGDPTSFSDRQLEAVIARGEEDDDASG